MSVIVWCSSSHFRASLVSPIPTDQQRCWVRSPMELIKSFFSWGGVGLFCTGVLSRIRLLAAAPEKGRKYTTCEPRGRAALFLSF